MQHNTCKRITRTAMTHSLYCNPHRIQTLHTLKRSCLHAYIPRTGTALTHSYRAAGSALKRSRLWPGPQDICLWPRWNTPAYGRDRMETLLPRPGTALQHPCLYGRDRTETLRVCIETLRPMAGAALKRSRLWPGPHWNTPAYGQNRDERHLPVAGSALKHSCLWPGPHWNTPP